MIDNAVRDRWKITDNGNAYLMRHQLKIEPEPPQESTTVEIRPSSVLEEGAPQVVRLTRHERNLEARAPCLKHYGMTCVVCGFSIGKRYGPNAARLIHVHHLKPLSTVEKRRKVDPIIDLRPVWPNCHAVIYMNEDALSIDEVRAILQDAE